MTDEERIALLDKQLELLAKKSEELQLRLDTLEHAVAILSGREQPTLEETIEDALEHAAKVNYNP